MQGRGGVAGAGALPRLRHHREHLATGLLLRVGLLVRGQGVPGSELAVAPEVGRAVQGGARRDRGLRLGGHHDLLQEVARLQVRLCLGRDQEGH